MNVISGPSVGGRPATIPVRRRSVARREAIWGYVFISPWLIGFFAFSLGPLLSVLYFSLTKYSVLAPPVWVGFENYLQIFTGDPLFWTSLYNTVYYVVFAVPLEVVLAFVIALLLNGKIRGLPVYRTLFYIPVVVPSVASSVLWVWLLDPQLGILKFLLSLFGVSSPDWLQSEIWSKPAIVSLGVWYLGTYMIIYLAGLQGIPRHLYEAAAIDGASWWSKLWTVTIPMLTPTIFFNLLMGIINSFQVFAFAYIMTNGGPLNSTLFYVLYIYQHAFQYFEMGYATALSTILLLIVLAATLLVMRWSQSWVYYEGQTEKSP